MTYHEEVAFAGLRAHEIAALHRRDFNAATVTVIGICLTSGLTVMAYR